MDYMDPDVLYPQKADKLNLSLSLHNSFCRTNIGQACGVITHPCANFSGDHMDE